MTYKKIFLWLYCFHSLCVFAKESSINHNEKMQLRSLAEILHEKSEIINRRKVKISTTKDPKALNEEKLKLNEDEENFERNFSDFIQFTSQVDLKELTQEKIQQPQNIISEAQEIVEPVIVSLKKMSEHPRKIAKEQRKLELLQEKINMIDQGVLRLEEFIESRIDERIMTYVLLVKKRLEDLKKDLMTQETIQERRLRLESENHTGLKEKIFSTIDLFFSQKGRNFILSLLIFLLAWIFLSFVLRNFVQKNLIGKKLLWYRMMIPLGSIMCSLWYLYFVEDWFLVISLFLFMWFFGVSIKRVGTDSIGKLRFFMNLSSVKEGELLVWKGIPYLIEKIGVFSKLVNPKLLGGEFLVHYSELITLSSRSFSPQEVLFPTTIGDMVSLDNGVTGKVVFQSPDFVHLELTNLHIKIYTVAKYLEWAPTTNLSLETGKEGS